jgi:ABC-type phosphate transport system substrate-binding protein
VGKLLHKKIKVVVRSDASGVTYIFARALHKFNPSLIESVFGQPSELMPWSNGTVSFSDATYIPLKGGSTISPNVAGTEYSIGYCSLFEASRVAVKVASMTNRAGTTIKPGILSLTAATLELGTAFDAFGFADLNDGLSQNAWPIAGFNYVVMRSNITRGGDNPSNCAARGQLVQFFDWFFNQPIVESFVSLDHGVIPAHIVRARTVSRLHETISCGGILANPPLILPKILGFGNARSEAMITLYTPTYALVNTHYLLSYKSMAQSDAINAYVAGQCGWVSHVPILDAIPGTVPRGSISIPSYYFGVGIAFNLPNVRSIIMSPKVLGRILSGRIVVWNDPDLVLLNPALSTIISPITVVRTTNASQAEQIALMALSDFGEWLPNACSTCPTSTSLAANPLLTFEAKSETLVDALVYSTPYAMGLIDYAGTPASTVASFVNRAGVATTPTSVNLQACASDATIPKVRLLLSHV